MKVFPICQSLSCFHRGGQAVRVVGTVIQTHSNWSAIRPLDSHSWYVARHVCFPPPPLCVYLGWVLVFMRWWRWRRSPCCLSWGTGGIKQEPGKSPHNCQFHSKTRNCWNADFCPRPLRPPPSPPIKDKSPQVARNLWKRSKLETRDICGHSINVCSIVPRLPNIFRSRPIKCKAGVPVLRLLVGWP